MKKFLVVLFIILFVAIIIFGYSKYKEQKSVDVAESIENIEENDSFEIEESIQNNVISNEIESNKIKNNNVGNYNKTENAKKEESKNVETTKQKESKKTQTSNNKKRTVVIDPGHQTKGDSTKEPIGPGATEMKAKVTTGATGTFTKQKESELVLKVSLLLEKELKNEGYNVIMTRTTNNVNISNSQRAKMANDAAADAFVRIHADSYNDASINRNINIVSNFKK